MDNYFTSFCLLTHAGVTNIRATQAGYANALSKKAVKLWLEQQQGSLRDLLGVWTKLKESIFKNNNKINSTITTRICVLSTQ